MLKASLSEVLFDATRTASRVLVKPCHNDCSLTYQLDAESRNSWEQLLRSITVNPHFETTRFREKVIQTLPILPQDFFEIAQALWRPKVCSVLLKGLPVGDLGPTVKQSCQIPEKSDWVSEGVLLGFTALANTRPFSFLSESNGQPFHNVVPNPSSVGMPTGGGSHAHFGFHIEAAFSDLRPDAIAILCLRGDKGAKTLVSSVAEAMKLLSQNQIAELRSPQFNIQVPYSFSNSENGKRFVGPFPAISGSRGEPLARMNFAHSESMVARSSIAINALRAFEAALEETKRSISLEPGSLLFINNAKAMHGRTKFQCKEFGNRARWLQRLYLIRGIRAYTEYPNIIVF